VDTLRSRLAWLVPALLVLTGAVIAADAIASFGNTLHETGGWWSRKIGPHRDQPLARSVMGAVSYFTTRPALAGNRLNLEPWHGFQEVVLEQPLLWRSLEFDVWLDEHGYLVALIASADQPQWGLRLSRNSAFPPACLSIGQLREFVDNRPLPLQLTSRKAHFRIEASVDGNRVFLNKREVAICGVSSGEPQYIGFRGGRAAASIDNLRIELNDGTSLVENFRNDEGWRRALPFAAVCILIVALALLLLIMKFARKRSDPVVVACAVLLTLNVCLGLYWAADRIVLSSLHPHSVRFYNYLFRFQGESQIRQRITPRVHTEIGDLRRLLFLGGSQTWGAGAQSEEDVITAVIQERLGAEGTVVEVVNGGIPSLGSKDIVDIYESEWQLLEPDIVVAILGNNDSDADVLSSQLRRLIQINRRRGITTLLVLEPNSIERTASYLERNWEAVRRVSAELNVPMLDMHAQLADRADDGFLWWDHVHLTSYGQRLAAEALAPLIRQLLMEGGRTGAAHQ
jgi:lysophospholipase L1-like esterase